MFCLYELPHDVGGTKVRLATGQALLRELLRRALRQEVHGLHEAHHGGGGHQVHLVRGSPLALRLLQVRRLPGLDGRQGLHHGRRGHHLPRLRQGQALGHHGLVIYVDHSGGLGDLGSLEQWSRAQLNRFLKIEWRTRFHVKLNAELGPEVTCLKYFVKSEL